jgi:hypothetical protein
MAAQLVASRVVLSSTESVIWIMQMTLLRLEELNLLTV